MSMHPKDGRMHGWWALFGWLAVLAALVWLVRFALQHFGLLALALALALPLAAQHTQLSYQDRQPLEHKGGVNLDSYRWSQIAVGRTAPNARSKVVQITDSPLAKRLQRIAAAVVAGQSERGIAAAESVSEDLVAQEGNHVSNPLAGEDNGSARLWAADSQGSGRGVAGYSQPGLPADRALDRVGGLDAYRWSQIAVAGVTALDIASSYGLRETNPLVGSGRFNGGMARKTAIVTGAGMLAQEWAVRRYPKMRGWVARMNFGIAGARGFVATWNFTR